MAEYTVNNNINVSVGGGILGGYFYTAPIGTELPDNPWITQAELEAMGYENTGYISSDGIKDSISRSSDTLTDMNGTPMGSTRGTRTQTWAITWAEVKAAVMREIYGYSNVTDKAGVLSVHSNNKDQEHRSYVALCVLRDERPAVMVIPDGQCFVSGDLTINSTTLFGREGTITGYGDAEGDACRWYIESTETVRPPEPKVNDSGEFYGKNAAEFGTFQFEGHKLTGEAQKIEGYQGFSSDPNEQTGYYAAFDVNPWKGVKVVSSRKPERQVELTEDDHFVVLYLGKDAPTDTKSFDLIDSLGDRTTYTVNVTAGE